MHLVNLLSRPTVFACIAWFLMLDATAAAADKRPNILFIVVDDLNNDLGCYGNREVKSPNIDRLAAQGVRFDRNYCQYPLCGPSRASFLSGRRPETTGVFDLKTAPRKVMPNVVFLPQLFRQQGYYTAGVGKVFHNQAQADPASWDFYADGQGQDAQEIAAIKARYDGSKEGRRPSWTKLHGDGAKTRDGITARKIATLMEEQTKAGKPFFLAAGFHKPHLPWTAPKEFFDLYSAARLPRPRDPALVNIPAIALMTELSEFPPPHSRMDAIAAYYACISFTDAQVGLLLQTLDRLKILDNTIIVLIGDNGFHLGDHGGLWSKLTNFENAARVPLLIAAPGYARDKACPRTVQLLDLYPTLAELSGLPMPAGLEGQSLLPLLKDPESTWSKPAFTMVHHKEILGKSIRTERWRYTEWDGGKQGAELYDHDTDPGECHNLAAERQFAERVQELKQIVEARTTGTREKSERSK